jgi:hypothetical protein
LHQLVQLRDGLGDTTQHLPPRSPEGTVTPYAVFSSPIKAPKSTAFMW